MSRFKKSEYRVEKRSKPAERASAPKICQGDMGLCKSKDITPCSKCGRPYCEEHAKDHPKYCLGGFR